MSPETYEAVKEFLSRCVPNSFVFISTGEPTLFYGLADFLAFCASNGFRVLLYSNAQTVPHGLKEALERGLNISFGFSIDGGTNEVVSKIQRGCELNKMLATIDCISRMNMSDASHPRIDINFIANASNIHTLDQLVDLLPPESVRSIVISPMKYFNIMHDEALRENIELYATMDLKDYFSTVSAQCQAKHIRLKKFEPNDGFYDYASVCRNRARMLVIDVDGDVLPCVGTEKLKIGNVRDNSFEDIIDCSVVNAIDHGLECGNLERCCAECSLSLKNRSIEYYE